MDFVTVLMISVGLAMDAFAVSVSNSMSYKMNKKWTILDVLFFGIAQGIMPIIGWLVGQTFKAYIENIDHYIALVLLAYIGIKMILEGIKSLNEIKTVEKNKDMSIKTLFIQSIATSIDALAVGISFAAISGGLNIFTSSTIIAIITGICCFVGTILGKNFSKVLGQKAEVFGGIILCLIGVKIFVEHMFF